MRELLRKKVRSKYTTLEEFASDMGYTRQTITQLLKDADMTQMQILKMCELLGIKRKEIPAYFFPDDVVICKRHSTKM